MKKSKQIFKLFLSTFAILLLNISCQKNESFTDDDLTSKISKIISKKSIDKLPVIKNLIESISIARGENENLRTSTNIENIDFSQLISILDEHGNQSYTINLNSTSSNSFEKLHIVKNGAGYIFSVQEFVPEANWLVYQTDNLNYNVYTGIINNYSLNNDLLWSLTLSNGIVTNSTNNVSSYSDNSRSNCECAIDVHWEDSEGETYNEDPVDGDNYDTAGIVMILEADCSGCNGEGGSGGSGGSGTGGGSGGSGGSGAGGGTGGGGGTIGDTSGTYLNDPTDPNHGDTTGCRNCDPGSPLFTKLFLMFLNELTQDQKDYLNSISGYSLKIGTQEFFNTYGQTDENEQLMIDSINQHMSFTDTDYPGSDEGYPNNWWTNDDFIDANFSFELDDQDYDRLTEAEKHLVKRFPIEAYIIKGNKPIAETETVNRFDNNGLNDKSDAFRHAFFNALNAAEIGKRLAKRFANAHETETPEILIIEKEMDLFNNEVGLNIGDEAGFFASDEELSNLVYQTHLEGNLLYLNPLDFSLSPRYDVNNDGVQDCLNCLNGIISLTQLIATDLP